MMLIFLKKIIFKSDQRHIAHPLTMELVENRAVTPLIDSVKNISLIGQKEGTQHISYLQHKISLMVSN